MTKDRCDRVTRTGTISAVAFHPGLGQPTISRLLLVAGPPAAGKTTLMRKMRNGTARSSLPLELGDLTTWTYGTLLRAGTLQRTHGGSISDLVLHVDVSQLMVRDPTRVQRLRKLLDGSGAIYVLTLLAPPETLRSRLESRVDARNTRFELEDAAARGVDTTMRKRKLLSDPAAIKSLYDAWFAFVAAYPTRASWVIDSTTRAFELVAPVAG